MNKRLLLPMLVASLIAGLSTVAVVAATTQPVNATQQAAVSYLGVGLSGIPAVVGAQLLANVPKGQGVLVTGIEPASPAEKAGLNAYDILLSYGDQKLYSPEQLSKLVRNSKAGEAVTIDYVHQGERATTSVIIGEKTPAAPMPHSTPQHAPWSRAPWSQAPWSQGMFHPFPGWGSQAPFSSGQGQPLQPGTAPLGSNAMSDFNSISISQVNGKYKVDAAWLDKDKTEHQFSYEGTEAEVKKAITEDKTLPDEQRKNLLASLNMDEAQVPDIRSMMQGFQHPFFQQPFFNGYFGQGVNP